MSTDPRFQAVIDEVLAATARPSLEIRARPVDDLPVTASALGGVPYLPPGVAVPTGPHGRLAHLAQFRLADLPANDFLPGDGMLQFWINRYDDYGMNDDDLHACDTAVIHFPVIDESVTHEDVLTRYRPIDRDAGDYSPFFDPRSFALEITATSQPMSQSLRAFDKVFVPAYNRQFPDAPISSHDDCWDIYPDGFPDSGAFSGEGHRLGGYPSLIQVQEPPGYHGLESDAVLLLQVDSDEHIMWWDRGVASLWITPADLAAGDFSRVAFYMDTW